MSNYIDARNYKFAKENYYFIDTCVFMHIFFQERANLRDVYSKLYATIIDKKIITCINQISELQNAYLKSELSYYNKTNRTCKTMKEFRKSNDYSAVIQYFNYTFEYSIKPYVEIFDVPNSLDYVSTSLKKTSNIDINDILFIDLAKKFKAVIVTHDIDFKIPNEPITVVSANTKFF